MNHSARLVLEASTGVLGPDAQILAEELCKVLGQRAELLSALKEIIQGYEGTTYTGLMDICVAGSDIQDAVRAIATAEAKA